VLIADDPHHRAALHMAELLKSLREIYPYVGMSGAVDYTGWANALYPGQVIASVKVQGRLEFAADRGIRNALDPVANRLGTAAVDAMVARAAQGEAAARP